MAHPTTRSIFGPNALTGTQAVEDRDQFYEQMDFLLGLSGSPWTHIESGDGSTQHSTSSTPAITHGGTGVGGVNNGAYYVLQDGNGRQILKLYVDTTGAGSDYDYWVSGEAGFSGGNATTRPTATDEAQVDSIGGRTGLNNYTTQPGVCFGYAETVSPYKFLFWTCRDWAGGVSNFERTRSLHMWAKSTRDRYEFASRDDQRLLDFYLMGNGDAWANSGPPQNVAHIGWYEDVDPGPVTSAGFVQGSLALAVPWGVGVTQHDGGGVVYTPMILRRSPATNRPIPGPVDLFWKGFNENGGSGRISSMPDDEVLNAFVSVNNLGFFWDSSVSIWANASPFTSAAYLLRSVGTGAPGAGADTTPPVIANINPAPGVIPGTREVAKQTPIEFDVTDLDPGVLFVLVTIKYAETNETFLAYNGTSFLFPFNSTQSKVEAITDGFHFEILPVRTGWQDDFEVFIYAVDSAGNLEGTLPP